MQRIASANVNRALNVLQCSHDAYLAREEMVRAMLVQIVEREHGACVGGDPRPRARDDGVERPSAFPAELVLARGLHAGHVGAAAVLLDADTATRAGARRQMLELACLCIGSLARLNVAALLLPPPDHLTRRGAMRRQITGGAKCARAEGTRRFAAAGIVGEYHHARAPLGVLAVRGRPVLPEPLLLHEGLEGRVAVGSERTPGVSRQVNPSHLQLNPYLHPI